jgi:hypothetical protein
MDAEAALEEVERQIRDAARVRARASMDRVREHLGRSPYQTPRVESPDVRTSLFLYSF